MHFVNFPNDKIHINVWILILLLLYLLPFVKKRERQDYMSIAMDHVVEMEPFNLYIVRPEKPT